MTRRDWGATGVETVRPFKFEEADRRAIEEVLRAKGVAAESAFFEALERAIAGYRASRLIAEGSSPAATRKQLVEALNAAHRAEQLLARLGGNAASLLGEASGRAFPEYLRQTEELVDALTDAQRLADEYPQRGRLKDDARLYLAVDVADAIYNHIGKRPTSTKGGLFAAVLERVLFAVFGSEPEHVHGLIDRALKAERIVQPGGLIEYQRPDSKG